MNGLTAFLNQMPMLLIGVPLCGLFSLGMSRWWGGGHYIRRTLLLNGVLSVCCAFLLIANFSHGSQRTRYSASESFQSINLLVLQQSELPGYRFGVDGCSLLLILCTSAIPLLMGLEKFLLSDQQKLSTRPMTPDFSLCRAVGLLVFQFLMLSFLLTIDRRVQIVILPFITLSVHYLLATFLSAEKRRSLNRRMRQLIMSDFLIVAGILSTLTPLMRYTALGSASAELFDIARILDAIELAGDEDLTGYDRLMRSVSPALSVMIVGCVLRFGTFPFTRDGREMWNGTAPAIRLIFWFYGPILGTAVLLRECQLFPIVCYRMFPILSYVWIAGLLWLAFSSRSRRNYNNDTQSFLFISTMLILALGGPNTTSIAGAMLLLLAIGLKSSIPQQLRIDRFSAAWLCHWAFHVMLASGMILAVVGTWQSTGPGSRELGAVLLVGLSIILLRRNVKNSSSSGETTSTPDRVLDRFSRQAPVVRGEIPVWEFVENPPSSPRRSGIQTALILFAAVVFLLIPQLIWTHVRWDLQKIQFPDSSGGFALGENPK